MRHSIPIAAVILTAPLAAEDADEQRSMIAVNHGNFVTYSINPEVNQKFLDFVAEEGVLAHYQPIFDDAGFDRVTENAALGVLIDGHQKMQRCYLEASWERALGSENVVGGMERVRPVYQEMRDELGKLLGEEKLDEFSRVECLRDMRRYVDGLLKGWEAPLSEEDSAKLMKAMLAHLTDMVGPVKDQESAELVMMKELRPQIQGGLADHIEKRFEQHRFGFGVSVPVSFPPSQQTRSHKENLLTSSKR